MAKESALKASYVNKSKDDTKKLSAFKSGDSTVGTNGQQFKAGNGGVRMSVLMKSFGRGIAKVKIQKGGR